MKRETSLQLHRVGLLALIGLLFVNFANQQFFHVQHWLLSRMAIELAGGIVVTVLATLGLLHPEGALILYWSGAMTKPPTESIRAIVRLLASIVIVAAGIFAWSAASRLLRQ
jgi:hypothetical protein